MTVVADRLQDVPQNQEQAYDPERTCDRVEPDQLKQIAEILAGTGAKNRHPNGDCSNNQSGDSKWRTIKPFTGMSISEVVRGADLLTSTARQIFLYRCTGCNVPRFFHCPLLRNHDGLRLAKRSAALSLRRLRQGGFMPSHLRSTWQASPVRSIPWALSQYTKHRQLHIYA